MKLGASVEPEQDKACTVDVAIGEGISQIPSDTENNHDVLKVPPAEECWPFSRHDTPYQIGPTAYATEP